MNKETIFHAVGDLSDATVAEAVRPRRASRRIAIASVAVCLCLAVGAGIFLLPRLFAAGGKVMGGQSDTGGEILLAPDPVIRFDGRCYQPLSETSPLYEGNAQIPSDRIGERIAVAEGNPSREIFEYLPVGCEAVVVVRTGKKDELYLFSAFVRYEENGDEDMSAYLALYGVECAADLKSVSVGDTRLSDGQIALFYPLFAELTDSSEEYFAALTPSGNAKTGSGASGSASSGSTPGHSGTDALDQAVAVCLTAQNGLSFEFFYYPKIGFISRHKVSEPLRAFLAELL